MKPKPTLEERARIARAKADRLAEPTAQDRSMAAAFPLGGGYGRRGGARRLDATIDRALAWQQADRRARELEARVRVAAASLDRAIRERIAALTDEQAIQFYRRVYESTHPLANCIRSEMASLLAPEDR